MTDTLPTGLFIAANATDIENLKANALASGFEASVLVPCAPDADLPEDVLTRANVLVIEVDPGCPNSLRRLDAVRAKRPNLPIIAAIQQADVALIRTLVRQGVTDVAVLPFDPAELTGQILDASARAAAASTPGVRLAPMISVVHSAGGNGATTVVTHLASELARLDQSGREICVLDLDLQGGEAAYFVGSNARANLANLMEVGEQIDEGLVGDAVVPTKYGFSLLAAPNEVTPLDRLNAEQVLKLLNIVRQKFAFVLVDLPSDWTDWSLSTALNSDEILLVTELSVASLRQAKRRLDLFTEVGVDRARVRVVVNRVPHRLFKSIGVDEVEEALGQKVIASLTDEGTEIRSGQDQGLLITDVKGKCRFSTEIAALARHLMGAKEG